MKTKLFLLSFIFLGVDAIAQQDPQFSQYIFLNQVINAGYAGTNDTCLSATGLYRNQWVGFPGAPKTFLFCSDAPIKVLHGGVGVVAINDKLGNFNFTKVGASYSYHFQIGKNGLIGIGLEGDIIRTVVTNNWLTPSGTIIMDSNTVNTNYNLGLGSYYKNKKFYIGISSTSLLPSKYYSYQQFEYRAARHYYITAGYNFYLYSRLKVIPSILIKSDAAVTIFAINLTTYWKNLIWAGASYRLQDAIVVMGGFALYISKGSVIKIGYAYDIGTSDLKAYHNNTHELLMNYCLKIKKKSE